MFFSKNKIIKKLTNYNLQFIINQFILDMIDIKQINKNKSCINIINKLFM